MKAHFIGILFVSFFTSLVYADYLAAVSGNGNSLLVRVTENGTVSDPTIIPSVSDPTTIISQYYTFGTTYYALHDYRYLFSYNLEATNSQTVALQVQQQSNLPVLCVSEQFGTLYSIQVTGTSTLLVQLNPTTGTLTPAALPVATPNTALLQQCIVDDAFSRVIWTYVDIPSNSFNLASTDLLPHANGGTSLLLTTNNIQQVWLFFDWQADAYYATSITSNCPQLWGLSVTIDGAQAVQIGALYKGVSFTNAVGAYNTDSGVISVFSSAGIIAQVNVVNATWTHFDMQWGALGVMIVCPTSITYID